MSTCPFAPAGNPVIAIAIDPVEIAYVTPTLSRVPTASERCCVKTEDVQIPIGVAANVCNVSVNVITSATGNQAGDCDAVSQPEANQGGGGNTRQEGLVNVNVDDVQVPIGIAANVCNVSANVLAFASGNQVGDCDAATGPRANQ